MRGGRTRAVMVLDASISSAIICKGRGMDTEDTQKHDETETAAGKDRKMLAMKRVEELLRRDAEAFGKQFEKLDDPEEQRRRFDRIIEQLKREGLDVRPSDIYEEPDYGDEST